MNKASEVAELIKTIRQLDHSQQIGVLMMCEVAGMAIQGKKKRRITRRSRLELP